jgi:hypothetical protein
MAHIALPDEHMILIGMIAIRSEVAEQLLDLLVQGWFGDLPSGLIQDVREMGLQRKARMLCGGFQDALPQERDEVAALFARLLAAQDERKGVLHQAWVLSEAQDIGAVAQPMLTADDGCKRVTSGTLRELDRVLASLPLELTLLFARATEARKARQSASPDTPEAPG